MIHFSKYGTLEMEMQFIAHITKGQHPFAHLALICSHTAGVVSILPISDTLVFTGSYDDYLRVFDYRNLKDSISSVDLEGGVWRILPRPQSKTSSFLTCCMQLGAQTVSLLDESPMLRREQIFEPVEERRLIYGASWHSKDVAAICSFYEKSLYICKIP
jgi:diphthine methyl ester acylhydrolase